MTLNLPQGNIQGQKRDNLISSFLCWTTIHSELEQNFSTGLSKLHFAVQRTVFERKKGAKTGGNFLRNLRISFFPYFPRQTYALWVTNFKSLVGNVSTRPEESFGLFMCLTFPGHSEKTF